MEPLTLVDRDGTPLATLAPGASLVVGRSTECDVTLPDPTVSRRHAEVRAAGGQVIVHDLGSRNGTFRNGMRVDSARLRAGDVVTFGVYAVRVEAGAVTGTTTSAMPADAPPGDGAASDAPPTARPAPDLAAASWSRDSAGRAAAAAPAGTSASGRHPAMPLGQGATHGGTGDLGAIAVDGGPDERAAAWRAPRQPPAERELDIVAERPAASPHELTARRLGLLLDVTKALGRAGGVAALLDQVVLHAVQTTDADRAALLVGDPAATEAPDALRPAVARDRWGGDLTGGSAPAVPRSIVRAAVERRAAVLSVDAAADPRFGGESVLRQRVRSAMCAPLVGSEEQAIGALYVDSASPTHAFGEEDLDYLTAFASVAAAAIENARLAERVREELVTRQNFERYFAPPVAERIARLSGFAAPGGERRTVAVLFADLRGFTRLATTMAPDVMAATLSEFFGAMVDCVFRHGGTLDKFIGDAVMAQWGAPEGGPDDADRAMHAAIDMQETLARLNARWRAEGARRPELSMGVGVAYGEVFAGNIGSERRLEFTVIGEAVNHASRLCDAAAGGEILVTEAVRAALREPPPLRVVPAPFAPERGATYAVVRDAA